MARFVSLCVRWEAARGRKEGMKRQKQRAREGEKRKTEGGRKHNKNAGNTNSMAR